MKLLIYQWNSYYRYDVCDICNDMSISFDTFEWDFVNKNKDEAFSEWFKQNIDIKQYDAVLSVNYYPVLSELCKDNNKKYIAWCYDNPLNVEHIEETLGNENNYVFLFDRIQFEGYAKAGFSTVYHLPLGVNKKRYSNIVISADERKKYEAEVAFIGNLYGSLLQQLISPLNEYTRGYLNSLMDMQSQIYGFFTLENAVTDELINDINRQYVEIEPDTKLVINKPALLFAMASEITRKDRLVLLNMLGRRYKTKFYSYDQHELIKNVELCGSLDYVTQMPKMFACSKININPSLRIIQTGIPQRALDIMGAGGFLLSNYQEELGELFVDGQDMVMYESIEDALEKTDFYLKHDELRCDIARNGREKVLSEHTMQQCIQTILLTANL